MQRCFLQPLRERTDIECKGIVNKTLRGLLKREGVWRGMAPSALNCTKVDSEAEARSEECPAKMEEFDAGQAHVMQRFGCNQCYLRVEKLWDRSPIVGDPDELRARQHMPPCHESHDLATTEAARGRRRVRLP